MGNGEKGRDTGSKRGGQEEVRKRKCLRKRERGKEEVERKQVERDEQG